MKNKKGFTLIELLAVIVILGLLMAIAIPSVTKYITESRKKTVVSTIGNYITAMVNEVNDLTYTFTENNTVYAVPIECIALERGGTNPLGKWMQANNNYWAYVLVQYDDETSSYRYGFTFKDSAGYGLYPTAQSKLNEQGKQIQTGLELTRPKNGKVTTITAVDKWNGFDVDSATNLVVLEATSEGEVGDGKTTCTLCQKGDNYNQVEEEKLENINTPIHFGKPYEKIDEYGESLSYIFYEDGSGKYYRNCDLVYTDSAGTNIYEGNKILYYEEMDEDYYEMFLISDDKKSISSGTSIFSLKSNSTWCIDEYEDIPMLRIVNSSIGFWQSKYKTKIKTITFQDSINIPSNISDEHKWDMTQSQTGKVMAYVTPNADKSSYYDLYIQGDGKIYANPNSASLFSGFTYLDKINNIELLDTSKVINMKEMFKQTGYNSTSFKLDLGDNFDTSNVKNMYQMFYQTGYKNTAFTLDLGNKFNTSNVDTMYNMFYETGHDSTVFKLDLGNKFNTSNVTTMYQMFYGTGLSSPVFTLNLGDNFDTSNVTTMYRMFYQTGWKSTAFTLDLKDKFDTSNVTTMYYMFFRTGENNPNFTLNLGSNFDTSKVVNMQRMFCYTGYLSTVFTLDLGDKFNTSNVTDMRGMFYNLGYFNPTFTLDLGDKFNTSNVTNMSHMFASVGYNSTTFNVDLGDKFNTSKVTDMSYMFVNAGKNAPNFKLDCSAWNVGRVTKHSEFNQGVTTKVTPPKWKN